MLTDVPPSLHREEHWGALNNPVGLRDEMLEADIKLLGQEKVGRGTYPLRMEPHWLDVYYTIDGFTVYDCRRDPSIGNVVYVKKGDVLPFYVHKDCGKGPASKTVSKQHYLMLLGPGGVLLCAAMKSGSSLWSGKGTDDQQPPNQRRRGAAGSSSSSELPFQWWWHLIPLFVDMDLQVEPAEVTAQRLDGKVWQVQAYYLIYILCLV